MDSARARRVLAAAGDVLIKTPAGPLPLRSFGPDEATWLAATTGKSPELRIGRKVLKILKELEKIDAELQGLGLAARPSASGGTSAQASGPAPRSSPEAQLAMVPYVPSRPSAALTAPTAPLEPPRGAALEHPATAAFETMAWEFAAPLFEFARPYFWAGKLCVRVLMWLPWLVHALLAAYFVLGAISLAKNPELIVEWAFAALDLVPNYAVYAGERMSKQVGIELAKRFR